MPTSQHSELVSNSLDNTSNNGVRILMLIKLTRSTHCQAIGIQYISCWLDGFKGWEVGLEVLGGVAS